MSTILNEHDRRLQAAPGPNPGHAEGALILYDGECGACSRFVQWVVARDREAFFRFAPLGGRTAKERGVEDMERIHVLQGEPSVQLAGAQAVRWILGRLSGRTAAGAHFMLRLLPGFLADCGYFVFARIRRLVPVPPARSCSVEAARRILP